MWCALGENTDIDPLVFIPHKIFENVLFEPTGKTTKTICYKADFTSESTQRFKKSNTDASRRKKQLKWKKSNPNAPRMVSLTIIPQ